MDRTTRGQSGRGAPRTAGATSADVARLARVSQSAVSRAFTEGASISPDTRGRILSAARQLGYRPNKLARSLISGRSGLIGLAVSYLDNQFYPVVLEELSRALQTRGYRIMLFMTQPGDTDANVRDMLQYQVEGVVLASAVLSSDLAQQCADNGIPVVLFNRIVPGSPASTVASDNIEGGRLVGDLLARAGHRRIAYIAGYEDSSTNRDREAGFLRGLAHHGRVCDARAVGAYTSEGARAAALALFDRPVRERPDAVFVANDHMAFAVLDTLRQELGLSVPEDVAVVGYDDVPEAAWKAYDLTTVEQPAPAMIEATVDILMEQIGEGPTVRRAVVCPARLVERGTTRRA